MSRTYEYNDKIKFMLPADFFLEREENDEGEEVVKILAGEYENDDGDTCYSFLYTITECKCDPDDIEGDITSENLFEKAAGRMKRVKVADAPETHFLIKAIPVQIFGQVMKMFVAITIVRTSDWGGIYILSSNHFNDDDFDGNAEICKNAYEVIKSIRVDGKKIPLDNISPEIIQNVIDSSFDTDSDAIDVSPAIKLNTTTGGETSTLEYTSDGMKEVGIENFAEATPDESLYPHYKSIRSAGDLGFLGVAVKVNETGTEYSFQSLKKYAESNGGDEDMKIVFNRIVSKDTAYYDLDEKAKEMQKLFHINKAAFDPKHDRECELEEGLMHRAYMMSGLRSFAWTLAAYCEEHDCTPEDVDSTIPHRIADFVERQDWLNYDDVSHCTGLCSGSDLHVFFIPDSVSRADRKKLLPSDEDIDRVKTIKESFPSYREILCEVHSLDDLRTDLEYIYPAIKTLWDNLEEERDYNEPLTGNDADIVYAWCALALAAKNPFFTEDGPTSCFFNQIGGDDEYVDYSTYSRQAADAWMEKYGKYVDTNPYIDFNGKLFVFTGFGSHASEKEHPIVQKVVAKGGQYRSKVSGLTNYLVVDPSDAGSSKIVAVTNQLQKGKKITVVLLEDLERALDGNGASAPAPAAKTTTTTTTKVAAPKKVSTTVSYPADFNIDNDNVLQRYYGEASSVTIPAGVAEIAEDAFIANETITSVAIPDGCIEIGAGAFWLCDNLETVVLPSTVSKLGKYAFRSTAITSIVIPDGCEEIGEDCFASCKLLTDIYVPASVTKIGDYAFCTFNDDTVIHTVRGSVAESQANDNNITVDYKSAPSSAAKKTTTTSPAKTATASNDDLRSQISKMEETTRTPEQAAEAQKILTDIRQSLADSEGAMEKYSDYLERKEKREKEEAERKARAKAEAQATGKSEKDVVNMYIILTNEKKLGQLHRSAEDFYDTYEADFNAFSKDEVLQLRKDIMAEMEDDALCSYYAECFKQRSVEERFNVSTLNLSNVGDEPHLGIKAKWAIDNSTEWYTDSERTEVKRLMDADIASIRADLDGQFDGLEPGWKKFTTAKSFLKIVINKKTAENGTVKSPYTFCKMIIGDNVVSVKLATPGFISLTTIVMDYQSWYWDVTVRDIWEAALNNPVDDEREGATDGTQIANQAVGQIRTKYPATTVTATPKATAATATMPRATTTTTIPPKSTPSATSNTTPSKPVSTTTTNSSSTKQTTSAKKEGCYIATAVYGSYDAPEVMTLRRFRDETLRNSALGRWFIRVYYRLSPPIANRLKNATCINRFVRRILDKFVENLNRNQ